VVTGIRGGGTRTFTYEKEPMSVQKLTDMAKKMFFPENTSAYGKLDETDVSLSHFAGIEITTFKDLEGHECTF
jgi:hypothetical protein